MTVDDRLERLIAVQDVRDVLHRYCRGIDRRQFDLVRSCYHADATDDHGDYKGGVDGFIEHAATQLDRYERTMHFIGSTLVEPDGERARSEAYAVAFHRLPARRDTPARDFVVGLRYVDDFERRDGEWRIATRVCVIDWSRLDAVAEGGWTIPDTYAVGRADGADPVFRRPTP